VVEVNCPTYPLRRWSRLRCHGRGRVRRGWGGAGLPVGPGYDATHATADLRVKPRRDGATYDAMWRSAIRSSADGVTITSYNEWHEGTQIEPARARPGGAAAAAGLQSYEGAYGRTGRASQLAYLDRTSFWSDVFMRSRRMRPWTD